jgi:ABC-type multidrug transport system ATPase subunit
MKGKTTLTSLILGYQHAGEGMIIKSLNSESTGIPRIGYCPQFDILWADLTVLEHLTLLARVHGLGHEDSRAHALQVASLVGLHNSQSLNCLGQNLSGGMKRRLSLAMALMGDPQLVLMDEPTTGVDPTSRQMVWQMINCVRRRLPELTLLITTHNTDEATILCDRVGILNHGQLCYLGRTRTRNVNGVSDLTLVGLIPLHLEFQEHHPLDQVLDRAKRDLLLNDGIQPSLLQSLQFLQAKCQHLESRCVCTCIAKIQFSIPTSSTPSRFILQLLHRFERYPDAQWKVGSTHLSEIFEQRIAESDILFA